MDHDYEAGLRDGKIAALEKMHADQAAAVAYRFNHHDGRITSLERVAWVAVGATLMMQFVFPILQKVLGP